MREKLNKALSRNDVKACLLLLPLVLFFGAFFIYFLYTDGNDVFNSKVYGIAFACFAYLYSVYSFAVTQKAILPNLLLLAFSALSFILYGSFSEKTVSFDFLLKGFMERNSFKLMNAAAISLAVKFLFVIVKGIYIMFVNYAREYRGEEKVKTDNVIFGNVNADFLEILCGCTLLYCAFFAAETHFEIIASGGYITAWELFMLIVNPSLAIVFGVASTLVTKRFFVTQILFTVLVVVTHFEAMFIHGYFPIVLIHLCCSYVFALLTRIALSFVNLLKRENRHRLTKGKIALHAVSFSCVSLIPIGAVVVMVIYFLT